MVSIGRTSLEVPRSKHTGSVKNANNCYENNDASHLLEMKAPSQSWMFFKLGNLY